MFWVSDCLDDCGFLLAPGRDEHESEHDPAEYEVDHHGRKRKRYPRQKVDTRLAAKKSADTHTDVHTTHTYSFVTIKIINSI